MASVIVENAEWVLFMWIMANQGVCRCQWFRPCLESARWSRAAGSAS